MKTADEEEKQRRKKKKDKLGNLVYRTKDVRTCTAVLVELMFLLFARMPGHSESYSRRFGSVVL